uniref:Uncharacterized protein n=1 Tax=Ascaris lumbricoides TaxID=6252 RepID=A0A0M3I5A1_ASCLU
MKKGREYKKGSKNKKVSANALTISYWEKFQNLLTKFLIFVL